MDRKINSVTNTKFLFFCVLLWHEVKKLSATAGGSVFLQTKTEIQSDDLILWTLGAENILVVKKDSGTNTVNERFRGRLRLGKTTASLMIINITNTDSGHFKLQIINTENTTFRRFNVTVTGEYNFIYYNDYLYMQQFCVLKLSCHP